MNKLFLTVLIGFTFASCGETTEFTNHRNSEIKYPSSPKEENAIVKDASDNFGDTTVDNSAADNAPKDPRNDDLALLQNWQDKEFKGNDAWNLEFIPITVFK